MDMSAILDSVEKNVTETPNVEESGAEVVNSETTATSETEAPSSTTSVVEGESEKKDGVETKNPTSEVASEEGTAKKTEAQPRPERRAYHRSSSNDLSRAQYSAQKWQKKYKRLREEYDNTLADFKKYRDLNLSEFEDEESKQQYLAWKASRQQRLQDMQEEMDNVRRGYAEERAEREAEVFNSKVDAIYGDQSDKFNELEDEWGETFEVACDQFDSSNVIRDFIRNSNVGPAIKNVIYGDDELQEELFTKTSGNPMIDASERLKLLKAVEESVYKFLNSPREPRPVAQPKAKPVAQKRHLPHLPPKGGNTSTVAKQPKVTGTLTRTDGSGESSTSNEVASLYRSIFG